jgi:hypothetical protein
MINKEEEFSISSESSLSNSKSPGSQNQCQRAIDFASFENISNLIDFSEERIFFGEELSCQEELMMIGDKDHHR